MKNSFKPITTENDTVRHTVFAGLCKGCRLCQQVCPVKCIGIDENNRGIYNNKTVLCDVDRCILCGKCQLNCPDRAIKVERKKGAHTAPQKPSA